jgi:hypothetical protein
MNYCHCLGLRDDRDKSTLHPEKLSKKHWSKQQQPPRKFNASGKAIKLQHAKH